MLPVPTVTVQFAPGSELFALLKSSRTTFHDTDELLLREELELLELDELLELLELDELRELLLRLLLEDFDELDDREELLLRLELDDRDELDREELLELAVVLLKLTATIAATSLDQVQDIVSVPTVSAIW